MSKYFQLSQCYSDVTTESASFGDFDECGYEIEPCSNYSLQEALRLIKNTGAMYIELQGDRFLVQNESTCIDYKEGRDRQITTFLCFKNNRQAKRVFKIFKEKLNLY